MAKDAGGHYLSPPDLERGENMGAIKEDGVKYTLEGREYTLMLTLSVLDAICDKYQSTNELFALLQSKDERQMRDAAIWTLCAMVNDDIDRQAETGADVPEHYTPEYIKRHTRAIEIRPMFTAAINALNAGLTEAAMAAGADDPNA